MVMKISRRDFNKAGLGAISLAALGTGPALAGPEHLIRKAIPSTGELVPVIGLGTNRYGVGDDADKRAVLRVALERFHKLGGTFIDTAPMYRSSEAVLGDLIADLGIRDDLFLATKADKEPGGEATGQQMQLSRERLKTEAFDLMQVHNLRGTRDALAKMREWQQDGRIRYIGITTSRARQYEAFEEIMRSEDLDFIQINYSLEQRGAAERILPLAAERGVAVIVNRAFGGGRIFEAVGESPLPDWAKDFGCASWAQFLLKYVIGHPAVTLSIPGMTKVHHVDDNFGAAHGELPDATQRKRQEAFFDSL
ncbi:MAG: aldo/keto reductase [Gammaproteobacteria bacterium]|nr:aldo/keto reductase [Gammaproteobacteria bacterium]NNF50120.1 aldo/keto reductase [Woeseiaceae bacterium]MBT8095280.1 aldo/keto reductase [Gammaproteobacteria bacterium]MBT8106267.1 aldo/keto reductase [Gammaproteobacteria bacterium]NNK26281.1 aldo/keto reductase [Woeseiaceae bacterium]